MGIKDALVVYDVHDKRTQSLRRHFVQRRASFLRQTGGDHANTFLVKLPGELVAETPVAAGYEDVPRL